MDRYEIFKILHVMVMAIWFGARLGTTRDLKNSLSLGGEHLEPLAGRMARANKIDMVAGVATLLTGHQLIMALGGMGDVKVGVHIGMTLGIVMLLLSGLGLRGKVNGILSLASEDGEPEAARAKVGGYAALLGIWHLLWLAGLVVMVLPEETLGIGLD